MSAKKRKRREHRPSKKKVERRGLLPGQAGKAITPTAPPMLNFLTSSLGAIFIDRDNSSVNLPFMAALWSTQVDSPEALQLAAKLIKWGGAPFMAEMARIQATDTFKAFLNAPKNEPFRLQDSVEPLRTILSVIYSQYTSINGTAADLIVWLEQNFPDVFINLEPDRVRRASREVGITLEPGKKGRPRKISSKLRPKKHTSAKGAFSVQENDKINASLLLNGRHRLLPKKRRSDPPR